MSNGRHYEIVDMKKFVRAIFVVMFITSFGSLCAGYAIGRKSVTPEKIYIEKTEKLQPVENIEQPEQPEQKEIVEDFKTTAYCPCEKCCGNFSDGITATGTVATAGRTIAVDPKIIPYGSKVTIDGKEYIAEDCGGAIKGNRIDIFFETHEEAIQYGVHNTQVTIERG